MRPAGVVRTDRLYDAQPAFFEKWQERSQLRMKSVKIVEPDRGVFGVGVRFWGRNRDGWAKFVISIIAIRRDQIERVSAASQEDANQRPPARVRQSRFMADRHLSKKSTSRSCAHNRDLTKSKRTTLRQILTAEVAKGRRGAFVALFLCVPLRPLR